MLVCRFLLNLQEARHVSSTTPSLDLDFAVSSNETSASLPPFIASMGNPVHGGNEESLTTEPSCTDFEMGTHTSWTAQSAFTLTPSVPKTSKVLSSGSEVVDV